MKQKALYKGIEESKKNTTRLTKKKNTNPKKYKTNSTSVIEEATIPIRSVKINKTVADKKLKVLEGTKMNSYSLMPMRHVYMPIFHMNAEGMCSMMPEVRTVPLWD